MKKKFTKTFISVQGANETAAAWADRLQDYMDEVCANPVVTEGIRLTYTAVASGRSTCYMAWDEEIEVLNEKFKDVTYETLIKAIPFSARTMALVLDLVSDNGVKPDRAELGAVKEIDRSVITTRRGVGKLVLSELDEALKQAELQLQA